MSLRTYLDGIVRSPRITAALFSLTVVLTTFVAPAMASGNGTIGP